MYKEFILIDKAPKTTFLIETYNKVIKAGFDSFCIPVSLIQFLKDYDAGFISAQIDYPFGLSSTKAKIKDAQYASSLGVSNIDVMINHFFIENFLEKKLSDEISSIKSNLKGGNLRIIVDYRVLDGTKLNFFATVCQKNNIDTVIIGSGTMVEDPLDNLISAKMIEEKFGINVVCTGIVRKKIQKEEISAFYDKIFGLRITTIDGIALLLGV